MYLLADYFVGLSGVAPSTTTSSRSAEWVWCSKV